MPPLSWSEYCVHHQAELISLVRFSKETRIFVLKIAQLLSSEKKSEKKEFIIIKTTQHLKEIFLLFYHLQLNSNKICTYVALIKNKVIWQCEQRIEKATIFLLLLYSLNIMNPVDNRSVKIPYIFPPHLFFFAQKKKKIYCSIFYKYKKKGHKQHYRLWSTVVEISVVNNNISDQFNELILYTYWSWHFHLDFSSFKSIP